MGLNAEGVDGCAFFLHAMEESEDGFPFFFLFGSVGFDVEVVVGQKGGGVGLVRGAVGEVDVVFADIFQPDGVGEVVRIAMFGANGFVDDIPGVNAAFVAAGDGLDVGAEEIGGILRRDGGIEPSRIVFVPAEIVAAGEEVIGFDEIHEIVGLGEIEPALLRLSGGPFHLILGDDDGTLLDEE